jgi:hypothetical protein
MKVWGEVFNWLGVLNVIPPSLSSLFDLLKGSARNAKIRGGFVLIWHAILWSLCKARNSAFFKYVSFIPKRVFWYL